MDSRVRDRRTTADWHQIAYGVITSTRDARDANAVRLWRLVVGAVLSTSIGRPVRHLRPAHTPIKVVAACAARLCTGEQDGPLRFPKHHTFPHLNRAPKRCDWSRISCLLQRIRQTGFPPRLVVCYVLLVGRSGLKRQSLSEESSCRACSYSLFCGA